MLVALAERAGLKERTVAMFAGEGFSLLLSARSGALAQRIGARIPLTIGPLVIAVGLLMMTRIDPGDSYLSSVLPAVVVFGLGLTLVVAPVTATVLAAADDRHSGIASGINTRVNRNRPMQVASSSRSNGFRRTGVCA